MYLHCWYGQNRKCKSPIINKKIYVFYRTWKTIGKNSVLGSKWIHAVMNYCSGLFALTCSIQKFNSYKSTWNLPMWINLKENIRNIKSHDLLPLLCMLIIYFLLSTYWIVAAYWIHYYFYFFFSQFYACKEIPIHSLWFEANRILECCELKWITLSNYFLYTIIQSTIKLQMYWMMQK